MERKVIPLNKDLIDALVVPFTSLFDIILTLIFIPVRVTQIFIRGMGF